MPGNWFQAVLKDEQGQVLANGNACFSSERAEIEFQSDFVPLYPLDTPLVIERLYHGRVIHDFHGKVYLSSKHLMRLVTVKDRLHLGAQFVYCTDLGLPALVYVLDRPQEKKTIFPAFQSKAKKHEHHTAIVDSIDLDRVIFRFTMEEPLEEGQGLLLKLCEPCPNFEAVLEVESSLLFGELGAYTCLLKKITAGNMAEVGDYILKISQLDIP